MSNKSDFLKHFKCFCGKPSVEADTWFNWYPCEDHRHLNPIQYGEKVIKYETY